MAGRRLVGEAMAYGTMAVDRRERFAPGAFAAYLASGAETRLHLQHDRERLIATTADGSLMATDSDRALVVETELREGSAELNLIRRGALGSLSVEFDSVAERMVDGVRVIEHAGLPGVGLVDSGSAIPAAWSCAPRAKRLSKRQSRPTRSWAVSVQPIPCHYAVFEDGAFDGIPDNLLAVSGKYERALGATSRGNVRVTKGDHGLDVEIDIDLDNIIAAEMMAAADNAPMYVRPYPGPGTLAVRGGRRRGALPDRLRASVHRGAHGCVNRLVAGADRGRG